MFKRFDEDWPPEPRRPARPARPTLSPRDERVLLWLVAANLLLLLLAPIAGASLIEAAIALLKS